MKNTPPTPEEQFEQFQQLIAEVRASDDFYSPEKRENVAGSMEGLLNADTIEERRKRSRGLGRVMTDDGKFMKSDLFSRVSELLDLLIGYDDAND